MTTVVARAPHATRVRGSRALRLTAGLVAAVLLLVLVVGLSIAVGAKAVPLGEVWSAWRFPDESYVSAVVASRIPRTQLGLLVGAALAVAGVVIQGLTRNPLGDPGLLGVNAGASASLVVTAAVLGGAAGRSVWAAVPGALVAAVAVYLIGSAGRRATPVRLVLAGAAVSAVLIALVEAITLANPEVFDTYRFWVVGSLAGRPPTTVAAVLPFIVVGLVLCLLLARPLNALALGDEAATSLGLRAGRTRLLGAAGATVL
uniref:FecCD family ABC transporter permease n=1 Tax=uncultured Cellulomonas sp. TaxID=189682 RepID=UPI0028E8A1C2